MTDRLAAAVAELVAALRADAAPIGNAPDRLLNIDQAAAQLGIGRSLAYRLIAQGDLRTLQVGRRRLVAASAVASYIAQNGAADASTSSVAQEDRRVIVDRHRPAA